MKVFKAVIEVPRKGLLEKEFECETIEEAERIARGYGKVISCKKIFSLGKLEPALENSDRQIFMQRLAAMQASKVGAGEALALIEATFTGKIKRVAGRMLKLIEQGSDIGEAMDKLGAQDFPKSTVALVIAGSKGGDTASALRNAAEFEAEMERIKREGGAGLGSGIVGFLSAVGITFGTTRYMGPKTLESDLMAIAGESIDVDWAITLGSFCEWSMGLFSLLALSLWLLSGWVKKITPLFADQLILKIPFYKDLVLSRNNYTTLYGLSMLTKSGVPMEQALKLSAEGSPKGQLQQDLFDAVDNVKRGKPWSDAMQNLHPTDRASLGSSLDREGVARALDAIAVQYRSLYGTRIKTLAPIIQGIAVTFLCLSGAVLFGLTIVPMMQFATADIG